MRLTLSQVRALDVMFLEEASRHWRLVADWWETSFDAIHQHAHAPGGTSWWGTAAQTAQTVTGTDSVKAKDIATILYKGADIASRAATDIHGSKEDVLNAVSDAARDGFVADESWRLNDVQPVQPLLVPQRESLMAAHQARVVAAETQLEATDASYAAQLGAVMPQISQFDITDGGAGTDPVGDFYSQMMDRLPAAAATPQDTPGESAWNRIFHDHPGCTTHEFQNKWAAYIGAGGLIGGGVTQPEAWPTLPFAVLGAKPTWDDLLKCYGIGGG